MQIVLVSNIPHYHHLAEALAGRGWLRQYVTCPSLFPDEHPWPFLSAFWARKLAGRRLTGVPRRLVHQLYLPELLQKALPRLRLASLDQADAVNNHLFDRGAAQRLEGAHALHFTSSVGLHCAREARRRGSLVVCDVRQEHPAFQKAILAEESERLGVPYAVPGSSFESRVLEEFGLADYLVVPSEHARRTFLEQGFDESRVVVIPYGVDAALFGAEPPLACRANTHGPLEVLYAGAINLRKGLSYLIEAVAAMPAAEVRLTLVGAVSPEMRPLLARHEGRFTHRPAVPKRDLGAIYQSAGVFVMPSLADSFSLATLEAMAAGLPVIVSENTGARDAVVPGANGFVVPVRDPAAIEEKLLWLSRHRDDARAMGVKAKDAAAGFTWARYGQAAVNFHEQAAVNRV